MVTTAHYPAYRALAERCSAVDRGGLTGAFAVGGAVTRATAFLKEAADRRFLRMPEEARLP